MSILINMEMPKEPDEWIEIAIFGDGKVIQTGESWRNLENGKCYCATTTSEKFFKAVPVPEHGDLIDRDAYEKLLRGLGSRDYRREKGTICDAIKFLHPHYAPTIIPASKEDE